MSTGTNKHHYVIIMAGGIGSRFWPVSKRDFPKQFIDILGVGKSLLRLTWERMIQLVPPENIYLVTNRDYKSMALEHLPEIDPSQILVEPMAKNTAPCIGYASHRIHARDPKAVCVVAPSDHLILNENDFLDHLRLALNFAEQNEILLTLGIKPTRPDTGYGYIQHFEIPVQDNFFKVKTFTEKPTLELAKSFLGSGDFLWNSGIFIWKSSVILKEFSNYLPEIDGLFKQGAGAWNTVKEEAFIEKIYPQCRNISIDYGVLEKSEDVYVLPSDFGWSDLGTWKSLYDVKSATHGDNVVIGKNVLLSESADNLVFSAGKRLVVMRGIEGMVVVDSGDVILIFPKDREQEIRDVVNLVKDRYKDKFS